MDSQFFIDLLAENQFFHYSESLASLKAKEIKTSVYYPLIKKVYQEELGGLQNIPPLLVPSWDVELKDLKVAIKLDTALDFNRFRIHTFRSELYQQLPHFATDKMLMVCKRQETNCMKIGAVQDNWTDAFSESHFGESELSGDLGGRGSAKWKMRAFQNFLLDLTPLIKNYQMLRINPYETLLIKGKIMKLEELALSRNEQNKKYLMNNLLRKISKLEG